MGLLYYYILCLILFIVSSYPSTSKCVCFKDYSFNALSLRGLVSCGRCNKLQQPWWFAVTEIYSLGVEFWKPNVWNPDAGRAELPPEALRGKPSLPLPAAGGGRRFLAWGCLSLLHIQTTFFSLCVCLSKLSLPLIMMDMSVFWTQLHKLG